MIKQCSICGVTFESNIPRKNVCGFDCRMQANRDNSLRIMRIKRSNGTKSMEPCIVCGFPISENHHEGYKNTYKLCPNHHAAITRGYATLDQVLDGWPIM